MESFFVFTTENDADTALSITGRKYKYQRIDGKWVIDSVSPKPEGLPEHTEENESIEWYPEDSKQYTTLRQVIIDELEVKYAKIDIAYSKLKSEFTAENVLMGIDKLGMTESVLDALEKVDYCLRSRSITIFPSVIAAVPRSSPFLTDDRLERFKNRFYEILEEI